MKILNFPGKVRSREALNDLLPVGRVEIPLEFQLEQTGQLGWDDKYLVGELSTGGRQKWKCELGIYSIVINTPTKK